MRMRLSTSGPWHWKVPWGTREPMSVSHETLGDREPLLSISDGVEQVPWTNQEPPSFMAGRVREKKKRDPYSKDIHYSINKEYATTKYDVRRHPKKHAR